MIGGKSMSKELEVSYQFLSVLMNDPKYFDITFIEEKHFDGILKEVFKAMKVMYLKNGGILLPELMTNKKLDANLVSSIYAAYYTSNIDYFNMLQKSVIENYQKRNIAEITDNLMNNVIDLDTYEVEYRKIMKDKVIQAKTITSDLLISSCTQKSKEIRFKRFTNLNEKLKLSENDFMVLAGGTGVGKTSAALNMMLDLSERYKCLYINMEMSDDVLHQRMIGIQSGVAMNKLKGYKLLDNETVNKVNAAINDIHHNDISEFSGSNTIGQIRNIISSIRTDKHIIVFIDHIGLIRYPGVRNSYERATEVAKELRRTCLDFNCTIIGLCQLNRLQQTDNKPRLSLLRDSGEIEQSARKVMFIWKTETSDGEKYEFVIEKNDSNPKKIIDLGYNKDSQRIYEKTYYKQ